MAKPAKKIIKTYVQLSNELSEILQWFENENLDLDKAVAKYEQAIKLLAEMESYLQTAENKVKKISAHFKS
jgi:exodeoxyribonuclease VII small subunit